MPEKPGEHPPLPLAEDEQPEIGTADQDSQPSADGGDLPAHSQTVRTRSKLRAAIRSVYRAPHPSATPEPEPEEPASPPEEETSQPGESTGPVEEYSIPAPAEFSPVEPGGSRVEEKQAGHISIADPAEKVPPAPELAQPEVSSPQEEMDPNPTLAEEPTLSTMQLETFAHASQSEEYPENLAHTRAPQEDDLRKAAQAQALIAKARLLARQNQFEMARRLFGQAITQDPTNAEAWTWLGGLLAEVNLDRAKICLTRAIELDATNERANRGLAEVNKRLEERNRKQEEESASRAIVLARPEIKIGLEEIIDRQRRRGLEPDPESIPLGGAQFGPAIERGELKPHQFGPPRLGKVPVGIGLVVLVGIIAALIWLGPLSRGNAETPNSTAFAGLTGQAGSNLPGGQVQTQVAAAGAVPGTTDETFALKIRLEIDHYNRFFLTARDLRSQIQGNKISWETYAQSAKQLQADIKAEKKPLDNLAVETTPKLIQFYRELQNIANITGNAIDFTLSGIDNTSPEDLEEGNRQFNDAARHLTDLLGLLNQQMPLSGAPPVSNLTPDPTLPVPSGTLSAASTVANTVSNTVTGTISTANTPAPTPQPTATPGSGRLSPTPTP